MGSEGPPYGSLLRCACRTPSCLAQPVVQLAQTKGPGEALVPQGALLLVLRATPLPSEGVFKALKQTYTGLSGGEAAAGQMCSALWRGQGSPCSLEACKYVRGCACACECVHVRACLRMCACACMFAHVCMRAGLTLLHCACHAACFPMLQGRPIDYHTGVIATKVTPGVPGERQKGIPPSSALRGLCGQRCAAKKDWVGRALRSRVMKGGFAVDLLSVGRLMQGVA